jgi:antitoxin component YwqK of YwqJK toxin-antitoxin module
MRAFRIVGIAVIAALGVGAWALARWGGGAAYEKLPRPKAARPTPVRRLVCPANTQQVGTDHSAWCERPDGTKHGPWVEWRIDGSKRLEVTFEEGELHGPSLAWYANGEVEAVQEYRHTQPHGTWGRWYSNGQRRSKGQWVDSQPVGTHTTWYPDGAKQSEELWIDGTPVGRWTAWFPEGRPRGEASFDAEGDGGVLRIWDAESQLRLEARFGRIVSTNRLAAWVEQPDDLPEELIGPLRVERVTRWHATGAKQSDGGYRDGKQHGTWSYWDESGKLIRRTQWKHGNEVKGGRRESPSPS